MLVLLTGAFSRKFILAFAPVLRPKLLAKMLPIFIIGVSFAGISPVGSRGDLTALQAALTGAPRMWQDTLLKF